MNKNRLFGSNIYIIYNIYIRPK